MPLQVAEAGCFGGTLLAATTVVAKHNAPVAEALAHTLCCLLHTPDANAKDPAEIQEKNTPWGHRGGTEFSPAIAWRWPGSGRRLRQRPRLTADAKLQEPTANVDEGWSAQAPLRIPRQQRVQSWFMHDLVAYDSLSKSHSVAILVTSRRST